MRLLILTLSVALLTGCALGTRQDIERTKLAKYESFINEKAAEITYDESESLLLAEFTTDSYKEKFSKEVCELNKPSKQQTQLCEETYSKTLKSKLGQKYTHALRDEVESFCLANPLDCKGWDKLEIAVRTNHNANVEHRRKQYIQRARAQYIADSEARSEEQGERMNAAFSAMGNSIAEGMQNSGY